MADHRDFDAQKMFELYLHDYLVKKKMYKTAEIFRNEAHVSTHPVVIDDSQEGFLRDWFNIFYEVFSSRQQKYENDKGTAPVMDKDPVAVDVMQSAHATVLATNDKLMRPDLHTARGIMPPIGFHQFDGKLEQQAAYLPATGQNQRDKQQFGDPAVPFNAVPSYMNPNLFSAGSSFMQDEIYSPFRQPLIIDGFNVATWRHRDAKLYEVQQRLLSKTPIYNAGVNRGHDPALVRSRTFNHRPHFLEPHPLYRIHLARQRQLPPSLSASLTQYSHNNEQGSNLNQIDSELMKNKMKQPQLSQPFYQLLQTKPILISSTSWSQNNGRSCSCLHCRLRK